MVETLTHITVEFITRSGGPGGSARTVDHRPVGDLAPGTWVYEPTAEMAARVMPAELGMYPLTYSDGEHVGYYRPEDTFDVLELCPVAQILFGPVDPSTWTVTLGPAETHGERCAHCPDWIIPIGGEGIGGYAFRRWVHADSGTGRCVRLNEGESPHSMAQPQSRCPKCQARGTIAMTQDAWADNFRCTADGCSYEYRRSLGD